MHILFFVEKTYIHPPPLFGLRSSPFYSGYTHNPSFYLVLDRRSIVSRKYVLEKGALLLPPSKTPY